MCQFDDSFRILRHWMVRLSNNSIIFSDDEYYSTDDDVSEYVENVSSGMLGQPETIGYNRAHERDVPCRTRYLVNTFIRKLDRGTFRIEK